jgi:hypothetical protein
MPITIAPRTGPLTSKADAHELKVEVAKDGTVSGTAAPGAKIEIANLSTAATGFLLPVDQVEVVVADANGKFSFKPKSAESGDVLQVLARDGSEKPSSAVQVRVNADDRANDPRAAFVSLKRFRVEPTAHGVTIAPRTSLPLCEPDALLRFVNQRTGETVDVTVDPLGRVPPVSLKGGAGDVIDVLVSDDASRAHQSVGTFTVEKREVAAFPGQSATSFIKVPGRLFLDELAIGFGKQGSLGNCPVPAGASALVAADPAAIRDLIRQREDGNYVVTFHPVGQASQEIVVDGAVFTRGGSSPVYGTGVSKNGELELWFPLVEKAYAQLVGGWEVLGRGTSVGKVMSDFTGRDNTEHWLANANVDDIWQKLLRGKENGQAMACGTYPSSESARYRGTGLYANHAYSVVGLEEKNGERYVNMRNPWGGSGFSGEFQLKLADFVALYQVLNVC